MKALDSDYETMKVSLKKVLAEQKYICVTADGWTSHAQSYLGATVHFIDGLFKRQSYLLAFKEMKRRQTNEILAKKINEIFEEFGINNKQVTNIVTDGGSAFCKMFKKYGDEIEAVNVNEENDTESDDEDDDFDNDDSGDEACEQPTIVDEYGNEFVSEIFTIGIDADQPSTSNQSDDELNYFDEPIAQVVNQIKLPPQRRCASHLLNLISKDFEKHLNSQAKTAYTNTFNSLHSLNLIIRNSSYAKTICKETLGVILKFPCDTRWNSKFDCIKQCNR